MSTDRDIDLLVIGELNPDIIVLGAPERPVFGQAETIVDGIALTVGSSSAITACGGARLGLRVAFIGLVGDDVFGGYMLDALAGRRIDIALCRADADRRTGASVILGRGEDRAILTAVGTIGDLRAADVPTDVFKRTRHVHVGSLYLQSALRPDLAELLRVARDAGATVSVDPNRDPVEQWDPIDDVLTQADVCLTNLAEASALTGEPDPVAAARDLARRARRDTVVVVKLGAAGGLALVDGVVVRAEAPSVAVVDTTGAGDSFDAAFIAAWSAGWPIEQCLDLALVCGSASTRRPGGVDGQPTLAEARSLADELGRSLPPDLVATTR